MNQPFTTYGRLWAAGALLLLPALGQAASYSFQTINNNGDANFNQLLGINNAGTIAGYFGDATIVPNNGYTVTPPYGQANFTAENVSGAAQTQVIGINNTGTTVGFSVDTAGNNTGFVFQGNVIHSGIADPNTPSSPIAPSVNQLLGVNDHNMAVGFYTTSTGANQAYIFNISTNSFASVTPAGSTSSTAAGINNAGNIAGFATVGGNTEGFYLAGGKTTEFEVPGSTNTGFFGLNNNGLAVGYYFDVNGLSHGLIYNTANGSWSTVDDPNASANSAFGVNGTTINGINDLGQLVGFYSDGTHVNGLLATATATPEPASLGLFGLSALAGLFVYRKRK